MPEHPAAVALVVLAAAAEEAGSAGGAVGPEHPVADAYLGDAVTRRDDGAHVLVADHEAGLDSHPTVVDVEIGTADPGRVHANHHVIRGLELRIRTLLQAHVACRLKGHRTHGAGA